MYIYNLYLYIYTSTEKNCQRLLENSFMILNTCILYKMRNNTYPYIHIRTSVHVYIHIRFTARYIVPTRNNKSMFTYTEKICQ